MNKLNILITGATIGGIGFETALALASAGHLLHLTCRTRERAGAASSLIAEKTGCDIPQFYALDLSDEKSINSFAGILKESHTKLDVLINNAGFLKTGRFENSAGIEMSMAVNYFGTKNLTTQLLPLINRGGRIINVSSSTASKGILNFSNLYPKENFNGFRAYFNSKYALNMYTRELSCELKSEGVTVNALHPGNIITNIWGELWPDNTILKLLIGLIDRTGILSARKGALTSVYLALSPDVKGRTDGYYRKRKLRKWPSNCRDRENNKIILEELHQYHTVCTD